jgi:hypothetical protein
LNHIAKKKFTKKQKLSLILCGVFAVLLAVCIPISIILSDKEEEPTVSKQPEIIEGEARQNGLALAYPAVNKKEQIQYISIKNENGEYGFIRFEKGTEFNMYYVDENGEQIVYYPKICEEDVGFEYADLLKIDTSDGYSQYTLLDYLCIALQMSYFEERIPLSENVDERNSQLKAYGLTDDKARTVYFAYYDDMGNLKNHTVKIGEAGIFGTGFYFIIDNRPYVYSSINNYYNYALSSYSNFLKAALVSDGLSEDSGYGPYLTTGYYQWLNEKHDTAGEVVPEDSKVIVYTDIITPNITEDSSADGYDKDGYGLAEIDIKKYKNNKSYRRLINAVLGKQIGSYNPEIEATLTYNSSVIEFGEGTSVSYNYVITAIESFLTDGQDITAPGAVLGNSGNLVKVTYNVTVDGAAVAPHPMHAVIDISASGIPADAAEKIRNAPIGALSAEDYISFTVEYTKDNAFKTNGKYVITEIISIYDKKGNKIDTVAADSIVGYRYQIVIDGVIQSEETFMMDLSAATEGLNAEIKAALIGKGVSRNLNVSFDDSTAHYEYFLGFTSYKISRIDYFIVGELISAFRFQNSSDRDPYYGESLYENLMEDEHRLYGLNSSACESVVEMLGGLNKDGTSATAVGLFGDKVVEVGITPSIMEKYGLYAHTVYFELPRGIYAYTPDDGSGEGLSDKLDDYAYYDTLGFTLYISEVNPVTNKRYVASDLYNIVTEISADKFIFLDYDFETFWARRNIILMDINDIEDVGMEFYMSDLKGSYDFDLIHQMITYETSANGYTSSFNKITAFVTPSADATPTKLTEFMANKGYKEGVSLTELYDSIYPNDPELKSVYPDSLGTAYFKEAIRMIYLTTYVDVMPEAERAEAMKAENLVMRMTLDIKSSAYTYVYEFYRADDRRILVSIYQTSVNGDSETTPVSDFYLSTFAFKKIVTNFIGLLNGEKINPNVGYPDEK